MPANYLQLTAGTGSVGIGCRLPATEIQKCKRMSLKRSIYKLDNKQYTTNSAQEMIRMTSVVPRGEDWSAPSLPHRMLIFFCVHVEKYCNGTNPRSQRPLNPNFLQEKVKMHANFTHAAFGEWLPTLRHLGLMNRHLFARLLLQIFQSIPSKQGLS